jgi:ABC-type uncharacterized transport system involved in gliding motility auxiliary subunit
MQNAMEEQAHVPFKSSLLFIRNAIQHAMEEEALIPVKSLLPSISNATQRVLEEEAHINKLMLQVLMFLKAFCDFYLKY